MGACTQRHGLFDAALRGAVASDGIFDSARACLSRVSRLLPGGRRRAAHIRPIGAASWSPTSSVHSCRSKAMSRALALHDLRGGDCVRRQARLSSTAWNVMTYQQGHHRSHAARRAAATIHAKDRAAYRGASRQTSEIG